MVKPLWNVLISFFVVNTSFQSKVLLHIFLKKIWKTNNLWFCDVVTFWYISSVMLQFSIPWCFVDTMIDLVFSQLVLFLVSSLNFTTIKKKKICSKPCHSKMYRRVVQKCTVGFYYEAPVFFQWNGEDRYTLVLLFDPVVSGEKLHEQQKTQKKNNILGNIHTCEV